MNFPFATLGLNYLLCSPEWVLMVGEPEGLGGGPIVLPHEVVVGGLDR